jgi:NADH-quinone oxidoreductase subunit G
MPKPYVGLNHEDAAALRAAADQVLEVTVNNTVCHLPVRIIPGLPRGIAGLPAGLPGLNIVGLPAWGRIGKGPST